jgi:hypothetical protein
MHDGKLVLCMSRPTETDYCTVLPGIITAFRSRVLGEEFGFLVGRRRRGLGIFALRCSLLLVLSCHHDTGGSSSIHHREPSAWQVQK